MKFEVHSAKVYYNGREDKNEMAAMRNLGFHFKYEKICGEWKYYIDVEPVIEINNLHELMNLIEDYGKIVINKSTITIHNDYIE